MLNNLFHGPKYTCNSNDLIKPAFLMAVEYEWGWNYNYKHSYGYNML
jgi:hypothetical protein